MPDLHILRDVDRQIADLRTESRLVRQEFRFFQKTALARLQALENKLDRRTIDFHKIWNSFVLKAAIFIALMAAGKPISQAIMIALKVNGVGL
jgi:hypothetical protein